MFAFDNEQRERKEQTRENTYNWLIEKAAEKVLSDLVGRMLASQVAGAGDMPRYLGLTKVEFTRMMQYCFGDIELERFEACGKSVDPQRSDEHAELRELFLSHTDATSAVGEWMADILIAGCMGGDHLWQDLGLWSRNDLSSLIHIAFSPLADKNVHDMKWKKFFYKQLCIQEGVYTCRAPSCQVCADYKECFGPE